MRRAVGVLGVALLVGACTGAPTSTPPTSPHASSAAPSVQTSALPSLPPLPTATPDPLAAVEHTMDELKASNLVAEINVGGSPDWQASGFGSLWVAGGDAYVYRIDEQTNKVTAMVAVNRPCADLAVGSGSVWSPSCSDNAVDRIDPATNTVIARVPVTGFPPGGEGQLVAAYGYVWLFVDYNGTLARIDPATNKVTTFHAGQAGVSLVAANGSLWAAEPDGSDLLQISPAGKVLRKIAVANRPRFESAGEGAIWVLGQADGNLSRVDPVSGKLTATISLEVPGQGGCVGSGGGFVWVTMPGTPFIKVDPATNTVVAEYKGGGGDCISYAAGSVWLSNNASGTVWRLRP